MATTVYLVRHAEAEGNVYRRCHGQYDSLLTTNGEKQLPFLAKRFENIPLDAIFASDLYRARKTAKAIADSKGLDVQVRSVLREINMGSWEDKTWAQLPDESPKLFRLWRECPWEAVPPGGENIMQAGSRMLEGVREIVRDSPNSTIAVVTHGSAIRGAICILLGYMPERLGEIEWGDNTCVTKVSFTDSEHAQIEYRNDLSHLPDKMQTFQSIGWKDTRGIPASEQLWFRPVDLQKESEREELIRFAKQKYQNAYGNTVKLQESVYLEDTQRMLMQDNHSVTFGILHGEPAALVRLNVCDISLPDTGMVGSFVLDSPHRGKGMSQQMLGQAISFYRARGKSKLCAYVAEQNSRALGFYKKFGFMQDGEMKDKNGQHLRMVKKIAVPPYTIQTDR